MNRRRVMSFVSITSHNHFFFCKETIPKGRFFINISASLVLIFIN